MTATVVLNFYLFCCFIFSYCDSQIDRSFCSYFEHLKWFYSLCPLLMLILSMMLLQFNFQCFVAYSHALSLFRRVINICLTVCCLCRCEMCSFFWGLLFYYAELITDATTCDHRCSDNICRTIAKAATKTKPKKRRSKK